MHMCRRPEEEKLKWMGGVKGVLGYKDPLWIWRSQLGDKKYLLIIWSLHRQVVSFKAVIPEEGLGKPPQVQVQKP